MEFPHHIVKTITDHANVLYNLAQSAGAIVTLLTVTMYILGLVFAFKAIYTLKVYGEARTMMSSNASVKEPIVYLIIAAVFIYAHSGYEMFMSSIFGYTSPLAYESLDTAHASVFSGAAGRPLTVIMQVIGLSAFIRGFVMLGRASGQGQQPGGSGKGLMHIFGGILAMNIIGTINMIKETLYGT